MARRSDHTREELKALILEESWKIIEEDGFDGLTARKIAQNIKYAPGTIYNLFSSMDELYLQLNAKTLDLLLMVLNEPNCHNPNIAAIENMKAMAHNYMNFAATYRPYWLMLFNLKVTENRTDANWYHEKVGQLFTPLERLLEPYFSPTQKEKRKIAARVLWASVHGLCFLQETGKIAIISNQDNAPDMAGYLINTFIAGIEKEPQPSPEKH